MHSIVERWSLGLLEECSTCRVELVLQTRIFGSKLGCPGILESHLLLQLLDQQPKLPNDYLRSAKCVICMPTEVHLKTCSYER